MLLDAQEYLALAIDATKQGDHHAALNYLHEVLDREPSNALALYLLGAEHAELGLYERAIENIEKSLEINPSQQVAQFQLAMLYTQVDLNDRARSTWEELQDKTDMPNLNLFVKGMLLLMDEDFETGIQVLNEGLALETDNPALNRSIEQIIAHLKMQQSNLADSGDPSLATSFPAGKQKAPVEISEEDADRAVFLGAYRDNKLKKN